MMRALGLALILVALRTSAQPVDPCTVPPWNLLPRCAGGFFQFASTSGQGMGSACACTTPTGTKGETMTFARASSATCMKGSTTTGIANGDLVTCSSGQPRVMPGGDGTGALGLLKEHARTNNAIQSESFDNVAWTKAGSVVAAPIVTADQGVAPDGTTTADRVQFAACPSSTNASIIFQTGRGAAGANAGEVFCRGTSTSQTISFCAFDDGTNAGTCTQVVCPSTSWTWATQTRNVATTTGGIVIGCNNQANYVGGGSTGAADVLLWGGQYEAGGMSTSYIKTTTVAVTRAADLSQFTVSFSTNNTGSMAATIVARSALTDAEHGVVAQSTAGPLYGQLLDYIGTTTFMNLYFSAGAASNTGGITPNVPARASGFWDHSTTASVCFAGTCSSNLSTPPITTTTLVEVGQYSGAAQLDGVIKQVCVDPLASRCR